MNGQETDAEGAEQLGEDGNPTQVAHTLFPAPPSAFARFTRDNLSRYHVLDAARKQDEADGSFDWIDADPDSRLARQAAILEAADAAAATKSGEDEAAAAAAAADGKGVKLLPSPSWDVLLVMDPPRVELTEAKGDYTCFGEQWPVNESLPSLEEMGMSRVYPVGEDGKPVDRPAILQTLLRTMLKTYLGLVDVIMAPPNEYLATDTDPATGQIVSQDWRFTSQDMARQINDLSINFMHLLNESRPIQAREQLRTMMQDQLNRRRQETDLIRRYVRMKVSLAVEVLTGFFPAVSDNVR